MRVSPPGPPGQATAQWRRWLFPAALAVGFLTLLTLPRGAASGTTLSYTRFLADVGAGTVRAVTIGPAGQVTGSLANGQQRPSAGGRRRWSGRAGRRDQGEGAGHRREAAGH
jgi:hypothetical protein